MATAPFRL